MTAAEIAGLAQEQALREMASGAVLCRSTDGEMIWTSRKSSSGEFGLSFAGDEVDIGDLLRRGIIAALPDDQDDTRGGRWAITEAGRRALSEKEKQS